MTKVLQSHPTSRPELVRQQMRAEAKRILQTKKLRSQLFGQSFSREVAWYMLLVLYAHDRRLTIGQLTSMVDAPATTGLRWIEYLEGREFIRRVKHPTDLRVYYVDLTEHAEVLLELYLIETGGLSA